MIIVAQLYYSNQLSSIIFEFEIIKKYVLIFFDFPFLENRA